MKIDIGQLEFIDKKLRHILTETEKHFDHEFTITSLYRIADSGVHGTLPLRGTDWRDESEELSLKVREYINNRWTYDTSRPHLDCCMYHNNRGGGGKHLHIQVHPGTIEK